jgi:hypothetical protein
MLQLRADPWAPDYGMGFEAPIEPPEESPPRADPLVETADWSAPRSPAPSPREEVWFVDGVRRVDLRLVADDGQRRSQGLFGSYAVGSVRCDGVAAFDEHRVCRAVVVAGGLQAEAVSVRVGAGELRFEPFAAVGTEPNAPLIRLQELMREAERELAAALALKGAPLILVDGPLRFADESTSLIVGVIKRFVRRYLEDEHERLLAHLGPGDRTPLFGLLDQAAKTRGYSWYTRLAALRPAWHDHAGIVRCEVRSGLGLDQAVELADRVTGLLPAFAGRPADARTPQNLAPVAGLEGWLRHRMGAVGMIRRALLERLSEPGREAVGA